MRVDAPASYRAASRVVDVGGVHLHVVCAGPEAGPLVVLLHGFPELWLGWRRQIAPLAGAGFRVMVPDQRGYNLSGKPAGVRAYRLDALADDVTGLITAAGRDEAIVVGHDWGATVGWWTAVREPARVTKLAALNVAHPVVLLRHLRRNPRQMLRSWYIFAFLMPRLPEALMRVGGYGPMLRAVRRTGRPDAFDDSDVEPYLEAWRRPGAMTAMLNWYRALLRHPQRADSPRVTVPTLVIWGERDAFAGGEMARESLALCDDARLVTLACATHWVHREEARTVNEPVLEFARASC